jgi:hypothetical protein
MVDKALLDFSNVEMDTPLKINSHGRSGIISPITDTAAEAPLLEALERIDGKLGSVFRKFGY